MEALLDLGIAHEKIRICGDAKCVIDQMNGDAECNSPRVRPVYQRARRLAQRLLGGLASHQDLQWSWAPRSFIKEADALTRRAMAQFRLDADGYQAAMRAIDPRYGDGKITGKFLNLLDLRVYHPGGMSLSL
jgi:ribonuclease HI